MQASFRDLLPAQISVAESAAGIPGALGSMHPQEAALAADCALRRAVEFAEGRWCARQALAQLPGRSTASRPPITPVLRADSRQPLWPEGVVGSISHCDGWRAAAVASQQDIVGLGIDVEQDQTLDRAVVAMVLTPADMAAAAVQRLVPQHTAELVAFSAKEALFKLWYPIMETWLGFEEAQITLAAGSRLEIEVLAPHPVIFDRIMGRWDRAGGLVRTAVWISKNPSGE